MAQTRELVKFLKLLDAQKLHPAYCEKSMKQDRPSIAVDRQNGVRGPLPHGVDVLVRFGLSRHDRRKHAALQAREYRRQVTRVLHRTIAKLTMSGKNAPWNVKKHRDQLARAA